MPDEPTVLSLVVDGLKRVEEKIDTGLGEIRDVMAGKADRADVERLRQEHGARLEQLENARRAMWRRVGAALSVLAAVAVAVATVVQAVH